MGATLSSVSAGTNEDLRFLVTAESNAVWFDTDTVPQPLGDLTLPAGQGFASVNVIGITHKPDQNGQEHIMIMTDSTVTGYIHAHGHEKSFYFYEERVDRSYLIEVPVADASTVGSGDQIDIPTNYHPSLLKMIQSVVPGVCILVILADVGTVGEFHPSRLADIDGAMIARLRTTIQDGLVPTVEVRTLEGESSVALPYHNIQSLVVEQDISGTWTKVSPTLMGNIITFDSAQDSEFRFAYTYSTFTDMECQVFLDESSTLRGAALLALESLMFDSRKRNQWASQGAGMGVSVNDTSAQATLLRLYDALNKREAMDIASDGLVLSW